MGSPYAVLSSDRVSVIRTFVGFVKTLRRINHIIDGPFDTALGQATDFDMLYRHIEAYCLAVGSAEARLMLNLTEEAAFAFNMRQRRVLFLEARYVWTGWEKFQSAIVLDFSGKLSRSMTEHP